MNEQILEMTFHNTKESSPGHKVGFLLVHSVAGDAFCIGFYKFCFSKDPLKECVKFGDMCPYVDGTDWCSKTDIINIHFICQAVYKTHSAIHSDHLSRDGSYRIKLLMCKWPNVVFKFIQPLKALKRGK